ncbi:TetR/AcrR family transcriptional regulator [Actinoplanes sp. NPDC049265]|uniref:TetR/AcrR family transcriptional regulator n=1 Tax=Actinoplanes sp. NPDC049265 TaxID=3363902 RepID=UPI0037196988
MSPRREPVSRRERPAKPALSRDGVVGLAFRIMREEGLERVTMRRLASELDTGPASLYVYVRNTAELHGALLDELLAELFVESETLGAPADWRDRLIDLLSRFAELLFGYPSLARSLLVLMPHGPRYLRLVDTVLGLLLEGGASPRAAAWGVDVLVAHAVATAAEHGTRDESVTGADEFDTLATVAASASASDYPHLDRVRDELFSGTGGERMRWSFEVLLRGIESAP